MLTSFSVIIRDKLLSDLNLIFIYILPSLSQSLVTDLMISDFAP